MRKTLFILTLVSVALLSLISAQPSMQTNYTYTSNTQGIVVTQLNYQPYPANPGEYFDIWIQAQYFGSGIAPNATFILQQQYPFSLDPNESAMYSFSDLGSTPVLLHYRVRVDQNAVQGDSQLNLLYNTDGSSAFAEEQFNIQVSDAQTDFALVIQDSTSSGTSIGIANTGENTANSLIVTVPEQLNFRVTGTTNGQILGNLNSGDYTIATFQITPTSSTNHTLEVELAYTDTIGVRRTVIKDVQFNSAASDFSAGNFTVQGRNFNSGQAIINGQGVSFQKQGITGNPWFWAVIGIVVLGGGFLGLNAYRKKQEHKSHDDKSEKKEKENSKEPDWVTAERKKRQ